MHKQTNYQFMSSFVQGSSKKVFEGLVLYKLMPNLDATKDHLLVIVIYSYNGFLANL